MTRSTVYAALRDMAKHGRSPGLVNAPPVDGFVIGKTTVQYNSNGDMVNEWRRLFPEYDAADDHIKALIERVKGKAPRLARPSGRVNPRLMLEIPIPDLHLGMLSWNKETGEDYDTKIATSLMVNGVRSILEESPMVAKVLLVILGDYYHCDSRTGMTERSGNALDIDSRFAQRSRAGVMALHDVVELSAAAADQVELVIISGNHDWHSAKWLSLIMEGWHNHQKDRIIIRDAIKTREYVQHGNIMLVYSHGDTTKASKLASIAPAEQPLMWQKTIYRWGRLAHWHHRSCEDFPGITVETLPTMAAPEAYAVEHGLRSRRAFVSYLWDSEYGLRAKAERSPEEIEKLCKVRK